MNDIEIIYGFLFGILIIMFLLETCFVAKKDSCMYKTSESIKKTIFPTIKLKLIEASNYTDENMEKMCLEVIDSNIVKTKYTNNLAYDIVIKDAKHCQNTKLISVHIYNKKNELFKTVNEKKYFFITNKNGNYYINDYDNVDIA